MRTLVPPVLLLLAAMPPAQEPSPPPLPSAETLQQEFDLALRAWADANNKARADNDTKEQERLRGQRPEAAFAERFANAAATLAGREQAVPYLVWVVQRGPDAMAKAAMTTLMDVHTASPGVRLAVARIGGLKQSFGAEQCLTWLDRVLAKNSDPHVLAQAHYTRAAMHVGTRAVTTSDELRRTALDHLTKSRALLDTLPAATARSLLGLVESLRDEAERFEPGLPAPEIEGKDLDGVPFKLSDYRGKVVLLDFWGDW
ncbi:MAG: hypothetical protein WAT39_13075 [Planctomycetota bacterium]